MSKLHAQLALFGAIDEIVTRTADPEISATVERFLPGTTGLGQRGWYRELTRFLSQRALEPPDAGGEGQPRVGAVRMPNYSQALDLIQNQFVEEFPPAQDEGPAPPSVLLGALFASAIIGQLRPMIPDGLAFPGWDKTLNPLERVLSVAVSEEGSFPPPSGSPPPTSPVGPQPLPPVAELPTEADLLGVADREAFRQLIDRPAMIKTADGDPLQGPIPSTGVLRRVNGQWCSLLTTDWPQPAITLEEMKKIVDPQNWPKLCDFFVGMTPQPDLQQDVSRGWARVLETVSGDRTQWQLRTALKYWKGVSPPGDGIFINYDLDNPRMGDDKLVEVDSGFIWVTPLDPDAPASGVRIRTSKAVRIRGLSPTATAALAFAFGWGDASHDMLAKNAKKPLKNGVDFGAPSVEREPEPADDAVDAMKGPDVVNPAALLEEAEHLEMLDGWRGALIGNVAKEVGAFIDEVAHPLASDLAGKWSDGMTAEDIEGFGTAAGSKLTKFAVATFGAAASALRSPTDDD